MLLGKNGVSASDHKLPAFHNLSVGTFRYLREQSKAFRLLPCKTQTTLIGSSPMTLVTTTLLSQKAVL